MATAFNVNKQTRIDELQSEIKAIENKIDRIVKDGGKVALNDPLSAQLKFLRSKLATLKSK